MRKEWEGGRRSWGPLRRGNRGSIWRDAIYTSWLRCWAAACWSFRRWCPCSRRWRGTRDASLGRSRMDLRGRIARRAQVLERLGEERRGDEPGQHQGAHGKHAVDRASLAAFPEG